MSPKSLILKARLKPLAKKPPNGPIIELNSESDKECKTNGYIVTVNGILYCNGEVIPIRYLLVSRSLLPVAAYWSKLVRSADGIQSVGTGVTAHNPLLSSRGRHCIQSDRQSIYTDTRCEKTEEENGLKLNDFIQTGDQLLRSFRGWLWGFLRQWNLPKSSLVTALWEVSFRRRSHIDMPLCRYRQS